MRLRRCLESERGDAGIYSAILGGILFLFASMMVSGFIVVALGASALAQANSELTGQFRVDIQLWQKSSWADLENDRLKSPSETTIGKDIGPITVNAGGRDYKVFSHVSFNPDTRTYTMTKVSQRAVTPGQKAIDCRPQLTGTVVPGCIAASGTVTATPDDVKPASPAGVSMVSPLEVIDPGAGLAPYIKAAELDRLKVTGNQQLRISFIDAGGPGADDVHVGLYCTDDVGAIAISDVAMSFDDQTNAYYARIGLADFDRLEYCISPNLRITSLTGSLPNPQTITPTLAVLKALDSHTGS